MTSVTMTCMTTKQKFEVENPPVVILQNGRYAYRVACPWEGKEGKQLFAFKFCSAQAYKNYIESKEQDQEHPTPGSPMTDLPH